MKHHQRAIDFEKRLIFDYRAQWNMLHTNLDIESRHREQTLFISRDDISLEWWNVKTKMRQMLKWMLKRSNDFEKYLVNALSRRRMIQDMKKILLKAKSMQAIKFISLSSFELESLQKESKMIDEQFDRVTESTEIEQFVSVTRYIDTKQFESDIEFADFETQFQNNSHRLFKSKWSIYDFQRDFESSMHAKCRSSSDTLWAFETLMKICRRWSTLRMLWQLEHDYWYNLTKITISFLTLTNWTDCIDFWL